MGHDKTRIVRLDAGQQREQAENTRTGILLVEDHAGGGKSFELLFHASYAALRGVVTGFAQPGLAVVAVDVHRGRVAGSLCVAAYPTRANSAIIGRHSMADLYLDGDAGLSLRHLAVVVDPLSRLVGGDLRFRLLDLRTRTAFVDEEGRRMEALAAEGPLFVRCGSYALFCLPTGEGIDWPESAAAGWECIPERVYLEESAAEPDRWQRRRPSPPPESLESGSDWKRITHVQRLRGPSRARRRLLAEGEREIGSLEVSAGRSTETLIIGERAAGRGILLGRYDRCDASEESILVDHNLSRVHLLLVRIEDELYAIDTASTNGTWLRLEGNLAAGTASPDRGEWQEIRILPLDRAVELSLGEQVATLRWRPTK